MTSNAENTPAQTKGALAAALCYFLWGLVPLYWRQLATVDSLELIAHRHVWSLVLLLGLVVLHLVTHLPWLGGLLAFLGLSLGLGLILQVARRRPPPLAAGG